jgi:hypothetical protein
MQKCRPTGSGHDDSNRSVRTRRSEAVRDLRVRDGEARTCRRERDHGDAGRHHVRLRGCRPINDPVPSRAMRDATAIRDRAREVLTGMLHRPSMYGCDQFYEGAVRGQLHDLAFIDEREEELASVLKEMERRGLFSALGAWGVLAARLGPGDYTDELASIYAHVAAQLGYFQPARRLSDLEWGGVGDLPVWAAEKPRTVADVRARLGEPSYQNLGRTPMVLAYAGPNDGAWLYLDFADGALRDIRLPVSPFSAACVDLRPAADAETPEAVYRRFLVASLSGDEAQIRPLIIEPEDPSVLWEKPYPEDVARLLAAHYRSTPVLRVPPPDDSVHVTSAELPEPLRLVRSGVTWRVDPASLVRLWRQARAAPRN